MERNKEMQSYAARLNTFQIAHQLSKRRASAQTSSSKKKGAGNAVEWPHERPSGEELARAGFFYRPAQDSMDNVQCFLCNVKLDGWEPEDDALKEHLAHAPTCHWAGSLQAGITAAQQMLDGVEDEAQNPMSEALAAARKGTFELGSGWPHEGKRGWKCKVSKMVEAGWCLDPTPPSSAEDDEECDGVTCFYCNLSLDGWEPKDDPLEEHRRRSPHCPFFALVERFEGTTAKKGAKTKGKKSATTRTSTESKASRLSTQSVMSQFSEAPSFADVGPVAAGNVEARADDSVVSTETTASQATATGATKGKKKAGRPKAAPKGAKGRKRANTVEAEAEAGPMYPDLSSQVQSQVLANEQALSGSQVEQPEQPAPVPAPAKKTRKGTRSSKAPQIDSSVIEVSGFDIAPPATKKATRGRKPKAQPEPEPDPESQSDDSEVSAQLLEELEHSMDMDANVEIVEEATPQPEPAKPKRGVKRTSEGTKKKQEVDDVSAAIVEFPLPPKQAPAPKAKRGRKPSKQVAEEGEVETLPQPATSNQDDVQMSSDADLDMTKPSKAKKTSTAKGKGKGRKASSTRSSRSSKATIIAEPEPAQDEAEDLERDEREIESELERIAAEQAMQAEQEKAAEFEPSPSDSSKKRLRKSFEHGQARAEEEKVVEDVAGSPPNQVPVLMDKTKDNATPSPAGSDKENQPSSVPIPQSIKQKHPQPSQPILSPTKTIRIPLATSTPNRLHLSPSKRQDLLSPSKQISHLTSAVPWEPIDLDTIFLASPQPTPGALAQRLAGASAGMLTSPEKGMSVEAWVRWRAQKAELELRRQCEEMVVGFEREGVRGMGVLEGIVAVA